MKIEDLSIPIRLNIIEICITLYVLHSKIQRDLKFPISTYIKFKNRFDTLFNTDNYSDILFNHYKVAEDINCLQINFNSRLELQEILKLLVKEMRMKTDSLAPEIKSLMNEVIFKNPLNYKLEKPYEYYQPFRLKGIFN
ncbi:MAG: hypothetical protein KJ712_05025 [Bacteroidetes bacterium]|nr:hypothetical protein [Bacteroidota bacterium]MBU1483491.1 hypothetical protein [Bacteroidota bacterium]MBU1761641.1 hypothetical protein [Bacteroidota bacterium]MBU2046073.1 hypothetical protein [Bacteroidota bacterium]MBU2269028.1 hypothetical protein [Bacteroidota bacterium]